MYFHLLAKCLLSITINLCVCLCTLQLAMDYLKLVGASVVTVGAATAYYLLQEPEAPELAVDINNQTKILSVSKLSVNLSC